MKCTICNKETNGWDNKLNRPSCGTCLVESYSAYIDMVVSDGWPYTADEPTLMDCIDRQEEE